jgi:hypothetical protein
MRTLSPGHVLIIPSGWTREQKTPESDKKKPQTHCVLAVVGRDSDRSSFTFSLCNTGEGKEYHLTRVSSERGGLERSGCVTLRGVPRHKLEDGAFWYFFLRQFVYESDENGPAQLYDNLLPFLREEPLHALCNEQSPGQNTGQINAYDVNDQDFRRESVTGDSTYAQCVFGVALRRSLISCGLAPDRASYMSVRALEQLAVCMCADMDGMQKGDLVPESAGVIVRTVARELAYEVCLCVYAGCVEESYKHVCMYVWWCNCEHCSEGACV